MLTLLLPYYEGVEMLAVGDHKGGEDYPSISVAIFWAALDAGEADSNLKGEANLGFWTARVFSASGCGIIIKNGQVESAEKGLQGFVGKRCTELPIPLGTGGTRTCLLIVWQKASRKMTAQELAHITRRLGERDQNAAPRYRAQKTIGTRPRWR